MSGSTPGARALSRRELLKRAGAAGVVFTLPAGTAITPTATGTVRRPAATTLTAGESATLEAVLERLIPTDATGPGAREAQVLRYIQQALAGDLKALQGVYSGNLAALDAYAAGRFGAAFAQLAADQQDAVLRDLEAGTATGFAPSADAFFETVLEHALEGMFGDPYHGGNANFVGWDLIQFPGIKLSVPSIEQRIGTRVKPAHKSTTDYAIFKISKGR
jgi:gluconate 2-dehydrogenase gamma chain